MERLRRSAARHPATHQVGPRLRADGQATGEPGWHPANPAGRPGRAAVRQLGEPAQLAGAAVSYAAQQHQEGREEDRLLRPAPESAASGSGLPRPVTRSL